MFKRSKPDPEIYLHTAAQLRVDPSQCLAIEDSTVGITAGKAAGMKAAALIDDASALTEAWRTGSLGIYGRFLPWFAA